MIPTQRHPVFICIIGVMAVVLLSAFLAPLVKWFFLLFSPYCAVCSSLSEYELHRVLSRIFMIGIFLFLFLFRKLLFVGKGLFAPVYFQSGAGKWFLIGFALGVATLALQVLLAVIFDARSVNVAGFEWGRFAQKALKAFFSASLIGVIEEFIFRGVLYGKINRARSFWMALLISSLIYSTAHFFRPKDIAPIDNLTIWSGFVVLGQILTPFAEPDFIYEAVGLFLVGVCLVFAYRYSKSLYFAIGLHAGWVFVIKMDGMFVARTLPDLISLWGSSNIVGGIYTWLLLVIIAVFIRVAIPHIETKINERQIRSV